MEKKLIAAVGLALWLGLTPARAAYLPTGQQLVKLERLLEEYGKAFGAGLMLQVGNASRQPGAVAYWYKFNDDSVRWRLEEWVALPKGLFHLRIWDFRENWATVNEDIVDGGLLREIRFAEPIPLDGKEAVGLSELTLEILTQADPADYNRDPFPDIGPRATNKM
ncbi:MAG: hypothetical protein A3J74_00030 [Elusimicrobia bacterium RIFCSPHIGHO2_02_FULL_57_9]|nr:MAG: hypothetical protein A3J74_00030 [Elusimicrobia bacterium RIFCSPHIGHO2_02_FULL_57_9]